MMMMILNKYCRVRCNYTYTHICGNIINNNDERTHFFFRKIYLSHFIRKGCERVVCEKWVGDWTDCNILTLLPLTIAALLSHSAGLLNRGSWGPKPSVGACSNCLELLLEPQLTDSNLLELSVAPGYIIVRYPPASRGRCNCTELNPSRGYPDIFDRMHLFFDWRLGRRSICYTNAGSNIPWNNNCLAIISKGIQVRPRRHMDHYWRSKEEMTSLLNQLSWTSPWWPTNKYFDRSARTQDVL